MSNRDNNFEHIPQEKFRFVQMDERLHDKKLDTKARSFFQDAMLRFRKNKSSVVAAWILMILLLYSFLSPIVSLYDMQNKDNIYINTPAYIPSIAKKGWGILDGATTLTSQNETSMNYWRGIAEETGMDPVLKILSKGTEMIKIRRELIANKKQLEKTNCFFGACDPVRTDDLRITNALHYRLCYTSIYLMLVIILKRYLFFNTFAVILFFYCINICQQL